MWHVEQIALAEGAEAEFMYRYESGAPSRVRAELGIATTHIGGGVALAMRDDPTGYWNKALGFGFDEPVTGELLDRVLDVYRDEDSKMAVIQVAPSVLPQDWNDIRARHDLRAGGQIVKLWCPIDFFTADATTDLRVGPIGLDDIREFRMVAGANLFLHGKVGSLNMGAALPDYRNRGAQSALRATRAKEAVNAGCRWLVAETGQPAEGSSNSSLNNMLRVGCGRCTCGRTGSGDLAAPISRPEQSRTALASRRSAEPAEQVRAPSMVIDASVIQQRHRRG